MTVESFDIQPDETRFVFGGTLHRFVFANGYGASVVCFKGTYGFQAGLWELAVINTVEDDIDFTTSVADDVVGWLTVDDVNGYLRKIKALPSAVK